MNAPAAPEMPSPVRLIATLGLIAMLSGFVIVLIHEVTLAPIARNHLQALESAVQQVLPGTETQVGLALQDEQLQALGPDELDRADLFAGFAADGSLVGIALTGITRGYAGDIRVLFGYSPATQQIIGFRVLQSSETPGLGDKIEKDPRFLANFAALDVRLTAAGDALAHPVVAVSEGAKQNPWEIDGITGATVSSAAVAQAIRESAERWIPLIFAQQDQIAEVKP